MHRLERGTPSSGKTILGLAFLTLALTVFADTKPNVILLMADDMGWAQTGYYGYPHMKTPHLDDMAASGLRMDRFYAGAPSCTPTRASVMTGRTNDRTGGFRVGHAINKQEKMLSTAFRDAGYSTAHFGKWHLNEAAPPGHPLPTDDPHHPGELGFDYWLSTTSGFDRFSLEGGGFELSRNGAVERFDGDGSEVIVAEALKYIAGEVAAKKPVFVVIWYSAPHGPWEGSEEDIAPFLGVVDRTSANMLGEIVAIDRSIGHLRQGLKDLGVADNTLVWFTSDNGGTPDIDYPANCSDDIDPDLTSDEAREFGCYRGVHPDSGGHLRGFKKDFYEGGLRVPTIVEWPAGIEPRVSNFPSGTVDMFPTLIDVAGSARTPSTRCTTASRSLPSSSRNRLGASNRWDSGPATAGCGWITTGSSSGTSPTGRADRSPRNPMNSTTSSAIRVKSTTSSTRTRNVPSACASNWMPGACR